MGIAIDVSRCDDDTYLDSRAWSQNNLLRGANGADRRGS
jgi:hypothetical protein